MDSCWSCTNIILLWICTRVVLIQYTSTCRSCTIMNKYVPVLQQHMYCAGVKPIYVFVPESHSHVNVCCGRTIMNTGGNYTNMNICRNRRCQSRTNIRVCIGVVLPYGYAPELTNMSACRSFTKTDMCWSCTKHVYLCFRWANTFYLCRCCTNMWIWIELHNYEYVPELHKYEYMPELHQHMYLCRSCMNICICAGVALTCEYELRKYEYGPELHKNIWMRAGDAPKYVFVLELHQWMYLCRSFINIWISAGLAQTKMNTHRSCANMNTCWRCTKICICARCARIYAFMPELNQHINMCRSWPSGNGL